MSETRERKPRCAHFVGELCRCDYVWRGANGAQRNRQAVSPDAPLRATLADRISASCSSCRLFLRTRGVPCLEHTRDRAARARAAGVTR